MQVLKSMYEDESPAGATYRALVPCMLGTLVDFQQAGWATELVQHLCSINGGAGGPPPDYAPAGWCLAQHVSFERPDWAACILDGLRRQQPAWYDEGSLLQNISSWGGEGYVRDIMAALSSGPAS